VGSWSSAGGRLCYCFRPARAILCSSRNYTSCSIGDVFTHRDAAHELALLESSNVAPLIVLHVVSLSLTNNELSKKKTRSQQKIVSKTRFSGQSFNASLSAPPHTPLCTRTRTTVQQFAIPENK